MLAAKVGDPARLADEARNARVRVDAQAPQDTETMTTRVLVKAASAAAAAGDLAARDARRPATPAVAGAPDPHRPGLHARRLPLGGLLQHDPMLSVAQLRKALLAADP